MSPWYINVTLWTSLLFYLLFVDLFVIPHQHKEDVVFPYSAYDVDNGTELIHEEVEVGKEANIVNSENVVLPNSVDGVEPVDKETEVKTASEGEKVAEPKFLVVFLGIPGGKVNLLNIAFAIGMMAISGLITTKYSQKIGGLPAMMVTFVVTSLISTKIFFWLSEPIIKYLFAGTRVFESTLLIMMAIKLKKFHTDILWYMGSMFGSIASLCFSFTMMASEPTLVFFTRILLPLWIILLTFPVVPLIRGSLSQRESFFRKLEVWTVAIAPFCLAVLLNWWFHISWLGDIDIPKVSYKNTLVIYLLGLIFGSLLLLIKHLPPLIPHSIRPSSTPLIIFILLLITHSVLLNRVVAHYFLSAPTP